MSLRLRGRNRAVWLRQQFKRYPACGMAAFPLPPPPLRQARRGGQIWKIGGTMQSASLYPKALVPKSLASCDANRLSPAELGSRTPSQDDCHRASSKAVMHCGISSCNAVSHTPAPCLLPYSTARGRIYHGKKVANTCVSATFLDETMILLMFCQDKSKVEKPFATMAFCRLKKR